MSYFPKYYGNSYFEKLLEVIIDNNLNFEEHIKLSLEMQGQNLLHCLGQGLL